MKRIVSESLILTILYIVIIFCVVIALYIYSLAPVTFINGWYYKEKGTTSRTFFKSPDGDVLVSQRSFGNREMVKEKDIHNKENFGTTMNKNNFNGMSFNTFFYNAKENSVDYTSRNGLITKAPCTTQQGVDQIKALGFKNLSEALYKEDLHGPEKFEKFINDLCHYLFSPVKVNFVANKQLVWLSTPTKTKVYLFSENPDILDVFGTIAHGDREIVAHGSLCRDVIRINLGKFKFISLRFPKEMNTTPKLTPETIEQLNEMKTEEIPTTMKHHYFLKFGEYLQHSNQLQFALSYFKLKNTTPYTLVAYMQNSFLEFNGEYMVDLKLSELDCIGG